MKLFDFEKPKKRSAPKAPKVPKLTNKFIVETRRENPPRTKRKKKSPVLKDVTEFTPKKKEVTTTLSTKISENYEGKVNGIIALIEELPLPIKAIIQASEVTKTVVRQGYSMYVLTDYTIKVTDVYVNNKPKLSISIKKGKKHIFNKTV